MLAFSAVSRFQNTGLERAGRLGKDLEFFKSEYGLEPSSSNPEGPGQSYSGCAGFLIVVVYKLSCEYASEMVVM